VYQRETGTKGFEKDKKNHTKRERILEGTQLFPPEPSDHTGN
jgi:hypothetical protein